MLKSTSKAFKAKTADYIKKAADEYNESGADILRDVNNYCKAWTNSDAGEALQNIGAVTCYYDEQRATLAEWYEQTKEEANRFPVWKVAAAFRYQIERAFMEVLGLEKYVIYLAGHGVGRVQYRKKAN